MKALTVTNIKDIDNVEVFADKETNGQAKKYIPQSIFAGA